MARALGHDRVGELERRRRRRSATVEVAAPFYRNDERWIRIRGACCSTTGLGPGELDEQADRVYLATTATTTEAPARRTTSDLGGGARETTGRAGLEATP